MENIYANVGVDNIIRRDTKIEENNINSKDKRNHIRCAAVCLGLLCVLLLAAIIGVCVHYNNVTHEFQKGQTLLQTERDELQTERDQLQSERNKLKTERDQLQSERNKLKTERDQLLTERNGRRNKMNILEFYSWTEGEVVDWSILPGEVMEMGGWNITYQRVLGAWRA
ncbi:uncharacterized protein LOC105022183 isoform X2 [Esox lucius]|uniref:uncharacterized protein LOC105022183 isoform X2 n=1 Tax=Esox lucius TaxID=8010 RepID=UPI000575E5A4|nr:uncharacterized protein LOC105022183 isoform X2 [Esox lucius]